MQIGDITQLDQNDRDIIVIEKHDSVFFKLRTHSHILKALKRKFSYKVPGYFHMPSYKSGHWDGTICLFDVKEYLFPIGLIADLIGFCEESFITWYTLSFDISEYRPKKVNTEKVRAFYNTIFNEEFEPRDYQDNAVRKTLSYKRCVLELATGAGKSLVAYTINRLLLEAQDKDILLIVPTIMLVDQMHGDFKEYGWDDIDDSVEMLDGKRAKFLTNKKRILVSTWQSLMNKNEEFFGRFGAVIVDETHLAKGGELQKILTKCTNAEYRIGMTGTVPKEKLFKQQIFGWLGVISAQKKAHELIAEGSLAELQIISFVMQYPNFYRDDIASYSFVSEEDLVETYEKRHEAIGDVIGNISADKNILILVKKIKHLEVLHRYIQNRFVERDVHIIHGKTTNRNKIKVKMDTSQGNILIATYGTMSTGVSIKNINEVFLASSYKSRQKVIQSIGRGLRKSTTKSKVRTWDFVDDICDTRDGSTFMNKLYQQWLHRCKYYEEEKYPNKIVYHELEPTVKMQFI